MGRSAAVLLFLIAASAPLAAQPNCAAAIGEFRGIVETENQMGHVDHTAKARIHAELAAIETACRAGRNAEALRSLDALRSRHRLR